SFSSATVIMESPSHPSRRRRRRFKSARSSAWRTSRFLRMRRKSMTFNRRLPPAIPCSKSGIIWMTRRTPELPIIIPTGTSGIRKRPLWLSVTGTRAAKPSFPILWIPNCPPSVSSASARRFSPLDQTPERRKTLFACRSHGVWASMNNCFTRRCAVLSLIAALLCHSDHAAGAEAPTAPKIPRFNLDYMDRSVDPTVDFYHYACGTWLKENPIPADKSRWGAFAELQERNWFVIHQILDSTSKATNPPNSVPQKVGDFFKSAMDTNRLEKLGFQPIAEDLKRIDGLDSTRALLQLLADFHERGINGAFNDGVEPDARNSSIYAYHLGQGGLSLPDRDYYLNDSFAKQREAYRAHVTRIFVMLGESPADARAHADTVLDVETALAKASKPRVELRDPIANYHKFPIADLSTNYPALPLKFYLDSAGVENANYVIIGQPAFFASLDKMIQERPLSDWKTYLRWHLVHASAPYLHAEAENESFAFFGTVLHGQPAQEPRWQRSARTIDSSIGE